MIAGHVFHDNGRCSCGRRFADIAIAERADVGKPVYAHTGSLTETEYGEIVTERERIWSMVSGVATGSGPSAPPHPIYEDVPIHDDAYLG